MALNVFLRVFCFLQAGARPGIPIATAENRGGEQLTGDQDPGQQVQHPARPRGHGQEFCAAIALLFVGASQRGDFDFERDV